MEALQKTKRFQGSANHETYCQKDAMLHHHQHHRHIVVYYQEYPARNYVGTVPNLRTTYVGIPSYAAVISRSRLLPIVDGCFAMITFSNFSRRSKSAGRQDVKRFSALARLGSYTCVFLGPIASLGCCLEFSEYIKVYITSLAFLLCLPR